MIVEVGHVWLGGDLGGGCGCGGVGGGGDGSCLSVEVAMAVDRQYIRRR